MFPPTGLTHGDLSLSSRNWRKAPTSRNLMMAASHDGHAQRFRQWPVGATRRWHKGAINVGDVLRPKADSPVFTRRMSISTKPTLSRQHGQAAHNDNLCRTVKTAGRAQG